MSEAASDKLWEKYPRGRPVREKLYTDNLLRGRVIFYLVIVGDITLVSLILLQYVTRHHRTCVHL